MSALLTHDWLEANQRYLTAALALVRARLERHAVADREDEAAAEAARAMQEAAQAMPAPPALETLCARFGLSPFEREVLLLCAGVELEAAFAPLCAAAQSDPRRTLPTFSLALAALPEGHWSALTPSGPLRYWRLITLEAGAPLTLGPLRIEERVLHYLAGLNEPEERLAGVVEPVRAGDRVAPSHQALAERLQAAWARADAMPRLPVIQLCGEETAAKRAIAAAGCAALGLTVRVVAADALPATATELGAFLRLWEREAILTGDVLLLDCDRVEQADAARASAIDSLVEGLPSALILATRERRPVRERAVVTLEVRRPTASEQRAEWERLVGTPGADGWGGSLAAQFDLNLPTIRAAWADARGQTGGATDLSELLWEACRAQARPRLDDLAQRIEPRAAWEDLVLPAAQTWALREVAIHVRRRARVYEEWGFAAKSARGLGISALFAGPSGTGKTLAAEVLAAELRLDLYRIDLSQVVSKYIGETEKNLRRVFDAAEEGGAILLFDEADALFGKRSEVKDSHDRYANIEVSYLLQRMEAYRGLAILTTNMKEALDTAFLRRLRFAVEFPFPDPAQRAEIWRRIFPAAVPREGLDYAKLAQLDVTGGSIHNIALRAAFLAAEAEGPVRMTHLLQAARTECAKLGRALSDAETGGWT